MKAVMKRVKVLLAGLMVVALGGCGSSAEPVDMQQGQHIVVEEDKQEAANTAKNETADNSAAKQEEDVLLTSVYASARVGNTLEFGTYEQDNDLTNGPEPIKWEVVEVKGDSIKVVSCYILDVLPNKRDDNPDRYNWKWSTLRAWLNNDFLNTAFTEEEQECIKITSVECSGLKYVPNNDRKWDFDDSFDTGGTTEDKIFIPSANDGGYPEDLGPTEAAASKTPFYVNSGGMNPYYYYILNPMANYSEDGSIYSIGSCHIRSSNKKLSSASYLQICSRREEYGVRPVMWLKTK